MTYIQSSISGDFQKLFISVWTISNILLKMEVNLKTQLLHGSSSYGGYSF